MTADNGSLFASRREEVGGREERHEEGRQEKVERAMAVLDQAVAEHKPSHIFALFSGGHDSLTATTVAFDWARHRGIQISAAHINTTIGIEETREFVRSTCRRTGWPLIELTPPVDFDSIVMRFGFPGPAGHNLMYNRLKERCLRQLVREHKQGHGDHVLLVSGVRSQESTRRMRHVETIQKEGARVWVAPLHDWSKFDCMDFLEQKCMPLNPVVQNYHHSGECLCGAFARPGELDEIAFWYPETAERIRALERRAEEAGLQGCAWGVRPPDVHDDQLAMFARDLGPLCSSCEVAA